MSASDNPSLEAANPFPTQLQSSDNCRWLNAAKGKHAPGFFRFSVGKSVGCRDEQTPKCLFFWSEWQDLNLRTKCAFAKRASRVELFDILERTRTKP